MNPLDKLLEENGLRYEDLNSEERNTYNQQYFSVQKLTVEDVKRYVIDMKNSIALQLTDSSILHPFKDNTLKARLKNYILMEAFLTTPDKAEAALKKAVSNIKLQKGR